jgi:predicted PurR-regulated permease PerM
MANNPANDPNPQVVEIRIRSEQVIVIAVIFLAVIGGAMLAVELMHVFVLFFVALVLAATLQRPAVMIEQLGIPKGIALVLIYLGILGVVIGIFVLVIPVLVSQIGALVQNLPKMYSEIVTSLEESPYALLRALPQQLPSGDLLASQLQLVNGNVLSSALGIGIGVLGFLAEAFSVIVLSMYLILDQPRLERFWLSLAPAVRRPEYLAIWREIESHLGTYVRGELLLMTSIAALASIGYLVIGLPYPLALGALAGLLEFVPMIGPTLGAIPAVLVGLSISPQAALFVILYSIVIQVSENNILVPRMMGHQVGVRPVTVIVAVFAFSSLLGIPGAFLAIPLAAIFQVLMDHLVVHSGVMNGEEPVTGSNPVMTNTLTQIRKLRMQVLDQFRKAEHPVTLSSETADETETQVDQLLSQADQALTEAAQIVTTEVDGEAEEVPEEVNRAISEASELLDEARNKVEEDPKKE